MSPLLRNTLISLLRTAIVYLAAKIGTTISDDVALRLATEILPVLLAVMWAFYDRFRQEQLLVTAQRMRGPVTRRELEAEVKAGNAPSVNTPKDAFPV
jgi:hypothetical protein